MPSMHIKRIAQGTYWVRQYDDVLSVGLGEMSEEKLQAHLKAQHLIDFTPTQVVNALKAEPEITVQFRVWF